MSSSTYYFAPIGVETILSKSKVLETTTDIYNDVVQIMLSNLTGGTIGIWIYLESNRYNNKGCKDIPYNQLSQKIDLIGGEDIIYLTPSTPSRAHIRST